MNMRLLTIWRQIGLEALLDALVRSRAYVPNEARRVRSREELPVALQFHTLQDDGVVWRAWSDGSRIWFVKAHPASCKDAAGLQVTFFDVDGRLDRCGVWIWLQDRPLLHESARWDAESVTSDSAELPRHCTQGRRWGARAPCAGRSGSRPSANLAP